jgi:hypothetical protein
MSEVYESSILNVYSLHVELERAVKWAEIEPACRRFVFAWDGALRCEVWSERADGTVRDPGKTVGSGSWPFTAAMKARAAARAPVSE